jgi:hypothetical protein
MKRHKENQIHEKKANMCTSWIRLGLWKWNRVSRNKLVEHIN